jgi:hypothetical protein
MDVIVLTELLQAYKARPRPRSGVPFAFVLSDRGYGAWYSNRFVAKIMHALLKYRSLGRESRAILSRQGNVNRRTLYFRPRTRIIVYFLVSDSVRTFSPEFRTWLVRQACAFIVMRTTFDEGNVAFQAEAASGFKDCLGPTFQVFVRDRSKRKLLSSYEGDEVVQVIRGVRQSLLEDLIAPVTDRLVATALPIARSDDRLSEDLRLVIADIPTFGLPPIADCYLRVRLARSDLERFLALLDGIELLLKLSVIVLLTQRWNDKLENGSPARLRESRPLTMGSWVGLLESLVRTDQSGGITGEVSTFWMSEILDVQIRLIESSKATGFSVPELKILNQLGWINWITDFRNITKGHGILKEELVASLWHDLHEVFLRMVSGLNELTLSSVLLATREKIILRGWLRNGRRSGLDSAQEPLPALGVTFLKMQDEPVLLSPLVVTKGHDVFIWDGARKNGVLEVLSYSSGDRRQLKSTEIDPYILWETVFHPKPPVEEVIKKTNCDLQAKSDET